MNGTHVRISRLHGLTLIELLVSLSIIAILALIGSTSFSSFFERQRLAQAAEMLYTDLQWARLASMQINQAATVTFSGTGTTSWGYVVSGAASKGVSGNTAITLSSSSFAGNAVRFEPQGNTANAGTILLTLGNDALKVIVSSRSRVRLCDVYGTLVDYERC